MNKGVKFLFEGLLVVLQGWSVRLRFGSKGMLEVVRGWSFEVFEGQRKSRVLFQVEVALVVVKFELWFQVVLTEYVCVMVDCLGF